MVTLSDRNLDNALKTTSTVAGLSGLLLTVGAFTLPGNQLKTISGLSAIGAYSMVSNSERKRQPLLEQLKDLETIEQNSRKQKLLLDTHDFTLLGKQPESVPAPTPSFETVDPVKAFENSPHILIAASTGSGKSVFTRWILNQYLYDQSLLVIDPHANSGITVKSLEHGIDLLAQLREGEINRLVVGYGRDYESIYNMYKALGDDNKGELAYRFNNGGDGGNWRELNVLIEELPSIIFGLDKIEKGLVAEVNQKFLLESRKVRIRLIAIVQGDQVKLLGLSGASSLKTAYTHCRLGLEAIRYAGQTNKPDLEEMLTKDFHASLALHKKLQKNRQVKQMFRGTCWMVGDAYLPFRDVSVWNTPLESDLLDTRFTTNESQVETEGSGDLAQSTGDSPDPENDPQTPQNLTDNRSVTGAGETGTTPVESDFRRLPVVEESTDSEPSISAEQTGANQEPALSPNAVFKTQVEKSKAAVKSSGVQTVTVKLDRGYWASRYYESGQSQYLETCRPKWLTDEMIEKYFGLRGEGLSHSKTATKMFSKGRYREGQLWLKEVYAALV